jgi:uncharacterized protein YhdP
VIGQTFRGFVHLLGAIGVGFVIVVLLAVWRLSSGPVSLAFLSPYIADAFRHEKSPFRLEVGDTILAWAGWERTLDIRVLDVRMVGAQEGVVARVPELAFSLSVRALFRGMVAPKSIQLFGADLRMRRNAAGAFELGFGGADRASGALAGRLVEQLLAEPDAESPLGYLERLDIVGVDLAIEDQRLGKVWRAPHADVHLALDARRIRGEVAMTLDLDGAKAEVVANGEYRIEGRTLDLGVGFSGIQPSFFATLAPAFRVLDAFEVPMRGTATLAMTAEGLIGSVAIKASGGRGHVVLPEPAPQRLEVAGVEVRASFQSASQRLDVELISIDLGPGGRVALPGASAHPMPVRSLAFRGAFDADLARVEVTRLDVDLQGPKATASGTVDGLRDQPTVRLSGRLDELPVDDFRRYWPPEWGADAREWCVTHLSSGRASNVAATIALRADGGGGFRLVRLDGSMDIENVTVEYAFGMPKVRRTSGSAKFDATRFDIALTGGESVGLAVRKGTVELTKLDEKDQFADIRLTIDGPLDKALALIDQEPLRFAAAVGVDPARTSGAAAVEASFYFMLAKDLQWNDVSVAAHAELDNVRVGRALFGRDLSDGRLSLKVTNKAMDVFGAATFGGVRANISWRENFADKRLFRSRYELQGRLLGVKGLKDLGVDAGAAADGAVKGDVEADLQYTVLDDGSGRADVSLDLTRAELELPLFKWSKPAGVGGRATVGLKLSGDVVTDAPSIAIDAGGLAVRAAARYGKGGGGLEKIEVQRFRLGRTHVSGQLIPRAEGGWDADFKGSSLDLVPMWDDVVRGEAEGPEGEPKLPPLTLSAQFDRVWLGADRFLDKLNGAFVGDGRTWTNVFLTSQVGKGASLEIRIDPGRPGKRTLSLRSGDAGAVFRALDIYENMAGGTLELKGEYDDLAPGRPLAGRVVVKDYRVIRAPVLVRLLSIMALTGILEALEGDGLAFSTMEAQFTLANGIMKIADGKASGPSLGFTAAGTVHNVANTISLEGTVVPAYLINSALGKIPVLGSIFTGGQEGGGVFAATYAVAGWRDDPKVSVNPLAVLAPGFLRNVFGGPGEGGAGSAPAPTPPPGQSR